MTRTFDVAALAAVALLACDGQVDTHYRGEPLMTLTGKVVSSDAPLQGAVIPAFVFRRQDVSDWDYRSQLPPGTQTNDFIRGEVSGDFPNAFTMTVFDAPPTATLRPVVPGEPAVARGEFVAIPRDHPAQLIGKALPPPNPSNPDIQSDDGHARVQLCSERGECLERAHNCAFGSPQRQGSFPCGPSFPDQPSWETRGYSARHAILYVSGPVAAGSYTSKYFAQGAALAAGYHVLTIDPPADPALPEPTVDPAAVQCQQERDALMMPALQQAGAVGARGQLVNRDAYAEVRLRHEVDHPCPGDPVHRLADSTQPVSLTLTGPWTPFLFF